jgi:hypothetical protein
VFLVMFLKKHSLGKLFLCLMLTMFLGFGSFTMPVAATTVDELPITVPITENQGDYQIPTDPVDTPDNTIDESMEAEPQSEVPDLSTDSANNEVEEDTDEVSTESSELIAPVETTDGELVTEEEEVPDLSTDSANNEVEEDTDEVSTDSSELITPGETADGELVTEEEEVSADLPELIAPAGAYEILGTLQEEEVNDQVYAPVLIADTAQNIVGEPVEITFSEDVIWSNAITGITVKGKYLSKDLSADQYTVSSNTITLAVGVFTGTGDYEVIVKADGYDDAVVTQSIEKFVEIKGDGVTTPTIFTMSQLKDMQNVPAHLYSTINTWPTKKIYMAEGVKLSDLFQKAGIKDDAKLITIKSTDGFTKAFTVEQINAPRYYYPGLKENHEYFGYIPGLTEGAEKVDNILALKITESTNPDYLSDNEAPHLILGQQSIHEQTNETFVKSVGTITVSTGTPKKWENPKADKESGTVPAGTKVVLSTKDMDGASIHYTTDNTTPTVDSLMYNWIKARWWGSRRDELDKINHPVSVDRSMTLKAVAIGPGYADSDIVTYEYKVNDAYPPTLMRDTSNVCFDQPIEITFPDDQQWVDAITSIKVDNTELFQSEGSDKYTLVSNKITFLPGVFTEAKDYTITISATDFRDAEVEQKIVLENAVPPTLVADVTNNMIGQPIKITFVGDEDWQASVTKITVDGTVLEKEKYTVGVGTITIAAGVLSEAQDYNIVVEAIGYNDATVQKTMKKIPPVLTSSITDYGVSESIEITFTDDEDWRSAITKVSVGVTEVVYGQYTIEPSKIMIPTDILNEARDYTITVQASGYVDATVIQTIWPGGDTAPVLVADTTNNAIGQPLEITFDDSANWRAAITKVSVGDTELKDSQYKIESGKITIPANVLPLGEHSIIVNATGYRNAVVVQSVVDIPPVLTPQIVNNGVNNQIVITYPYNWDYRCAISAVLVDGNPLEKIQYYSYSTGEVTIKADVLNEIKDYEIVVQAKGYLDNTVIQPIKKAAPTLKSSSGYIGKALSMTFTDDPLWREAITEVTVDGALLETEKYTLEAGKLTFIPGVFTEYRSSWSNPYIIVVRADGYADSGVNQGMSRGTAVKLTPDETENIVGQTIELTFSDDSYWRSVITAVKVDNVALSPEDYAVDVGKLTIKPGVFTQKKLYNVSVEATEYNKSSISQNILIGEPPVLTADTTDNMVGQQIELTFNDDSYWRSVITAVKVDGVDLPSEDYAFDEGKLTIKPSVFTQEKLYEVTVQATGYNDSIISQTIIKGVSPVLTADVTNNNVGYPIEVTFTDNEAWRNAITEVTVNGNLLATDKYSLEAGKLIIDDSVFAEANTYTIVVKATAYSDTTLQQWINKPEIPQYNVQPAEDEIIYAIGETADGIKTMTLKENQTGFKYFTVSVNPVIANEGTEIAVFTHLRNDIQLELNASVADFDVSSTAKAGFNVNPGDVVKVYIVDQLTNDMDHNPIVFQ